MLLGIRWGSLRAKIIAWSFIPTMMIMVVVAVVIFYAYQQVTEDLVIERNRELARLAADQLATELNEYADLLDAEARAPDVYGNDPIAQRDALQRATNRLAVFDAGVLILDTFGTVVAAEPARPEIVGQDWADHDHYHQVLCSQIRGAPEAVFSDIATDGPGGMEVIVVAAPILGPEGEFVGTMVGMFEVGATTVSVLYRDIVKLRLGESGVVYLVDSKGRLIYHSDTDRIGGDFSSQAIVQRVLNGGVGAFRSRNGQERVASFAPVPDTAWGLITQESWAVLVSGSQGYRRFLLALLVLGVAAPTLVVAFGVRRITRPIVELTSAAQEVAEGKFGQTISVQTGDEVEELARQFNLMSAQLQESYTHLEQRVADRTKELAALNAIAAVVSQTLDLQEILENALDKTLKVTGLEAAGVYLFQDEMLTIAAYKGLDAELVAAIDNLKPGEGFSGRVAQTGEPMVVRGLSTDPRLTRTVVGEAGFDFVVLTPLVSRRKVLGSMFAIAHGDPEFSQQDVELFASIGHQIGVAVENARLFEAEQRRAEQFRLIGAVGRRIASILAVDDLLEQVAWLLRESFDYYAVGIALIEGDEAVFRAGSGAFWDVTQLRHTLRLKVGQEGLTGWVAATGEPLMVPDVTQDPRYYCVPEVSKTRSELVVPMKVKEIVIGVLGVQSDRLNGFDESDLIMLQALAHQAAIGVENARLFDAEQRRAEQFRVIGEVGSRITSILDIDEVLRQVAHLIQEAFAYDHVGIALVEGEQVIYKVGAGYLWDGPDFKFEPAALKVGQEGITGWVAATGEPLLAPDVSKEPHYVWMQDSKTRSELAVPIKVKGEVIGVLDAQSEQLNAFDESDLIVLQSLANQAAVALDNARLFEAEQRRAEQFRVIGEVGRRVTSILAIDELLDQMVRLIQEAFDYYLVEIGLVEGDEVVVRSGAGGSEGSQFESFSLKVDERSITGWVAATGEPLMAPDVSKEPRYVKMTDTETRSELVVPIKAKGKVTGVINVESDRLDAFDESDLTVLQALAHQAASAIENARLYEQAQQAATLEERQRLARELHDSVTQALYGVTLYGEAAARQLSAGQVDLVAEHLHELRDTAQEALREMRLLIFELRPLILEEVGLVAALQTRLEAVEGRAGLKVDLYVEVEERLPPKVETGLYRIAQEALNNALKHAQAQNIAVSLRQDGRTVVLEIADDGVGFDPSTAVEFGGLGMEGMEERAEEMGARLTMESGPSAGATVRVEVGR